MPQPPLEIIAGRVPPHNEEAERSVLGSMIRDNGVCGDVNLILKSKDSFYYDAHQKIFDAIRSMYMDGKGIDLVTLGNHLHQQKHIEDIGGYDYLARILDETPTSANAVYYAEIVRDKAIVRGLLQSGTEIARDASSEALPATEMLEGAERKIMQIAEWGVAGETITVKDALDIAYARLLERVDQDGTRNVSGIPTGYVDLDNVTAGLQNSELIIVAARPSVGKTAVTLNLMRNIAIDEGVPVFYASLEQSRVELAERLICCQGEVDGQRLRKGMISQNEMAKVIDAMNRLSHGRIFIDDSPGQNMIRIAANARRLRLREGIKLVIIDYLQLIEPDNRKESRQEQVANISRRLKFLAKELNIPVIACAQLNRGVEMRTEGEPRLSDLRESGSIEQDADTVMLLHRPKDQATGLDSDTKLDIIIAKQRNGPTGKITLGHIKNYVKFTNYAGDLPSF